MIFTNGTYRHGAVVLEELVSLPEGAQVRVTLESDPNCKTVEPEDFCCDGLPWDDSAEGIQMWMKWFDALEPVMTEGEFQQWEAERLVERERQKGMAAAESDRIAPLFR